MASHSKEYSAAAQEQLERVCQEDDEFENPVTSDWERTTLALLEDGDKHAFHAAISDMIMNHEIYFDLANIVDDDGDNQLKYAEFRTHFDGKWDERMTQALFNEIKGDSPWLDSITVVSFQRYVEGPKRAKAASKLPAIELYKRMMEFYFKKTFNVKNREAVPRDEFIEHFAKDFKEEDVLECYNEMDDEGDGGITPREFNVWRWTSLRERLKPKMPPPPIKTDDDIVAVARAAATVIQAKDEESESEGKHEEEVKMVEEVEGDEVPATQSDVPRLALSAAVKRTAPIFNESDVMLWAAKGLVHFEVMHCDSLRKFEVKLKAEDLEKCGFHPRDSAEDCVETISNALTAEEIDTVVVTPMAASTEGDDVTGVSIKVPFFQCDSLRICFALKMQFRSKLYEYKLFLSEQKLDAATRTQLQMEALREKLKAQSREMKQMRADITAEMKAAMDAKVKTKMDEMKATVAANVEAKVREMADLKSQGIASFRSNAMVGRYRKWNHVELAATLEAMVATSEDQKDLRIGIEGVYRIIATVSIQGAVGSNYAYLRINGTDKCLSFGGQRIGVSLAFVGRLAVGDTISVYINASEYGDQRYNCIQVEKL